MSNNLTHFMDTLAPKAGNVLKDADRLYRTNKEAVQWGKDLKTSVGGNLLLGPALLFSGGYRKLLAAGTGAFAANYISKMLADPAARSMITQIAKASAAKNTALVNKLLQKLDTRAKALDPQASRELAAILKQKR